MITNVEKYKYYIKLLISQTTPIKIKLAIFDWSPNGFILFLTSCAYNTLLGSVPLSAKHIEKLTPYKSFLKELATKKVGCISKRKLLKKEATKVTGKSVLPLILRLILLGSKSGRIFTKPYKSSSSTSSTSAPALAPAPPSPSATAAAAVLTTPSYQRQLQVDHINDTAFRHTPHESI